MPRARRKALISAPQIVAPTPVVKFTRRISLGFAAGCFGALLTCLAVYACGRFDLLTGLGIKLKLKASDQLFPILVLLGGLWGMASRVPGLRHPDIRAGLFWSIGPTFTMLVVALPLKKQGFLGLSMGTLTPVMVLLFSALWGVTTALWLKLVDEK